MEQKVYIELSGSATEPDYIEPNGTIPGYTGGEYDTQYHGIVRYYSVGKPGPLPDGREITKIVWEEVFCGDPERISYHRGYYIVKDAPEKPMGRPPASTVFKTEYDGEVREAITGVAKRSGNSSGVTLPVTWLGKRVICISLD